MPPDLDRLSPSKQHLLSVASLRVLYSSIQSFGLSIINPYVLEKLKRYAKPIIAASVGVYFIGALLTVPFRLLGTLVHVVSFGNVSRTSTTVALDHWVSDAVALVPLLVMLILRTVIRRPLYKTLVHALRDVNPQAAATLEAAPRLRNPSKANTAERVAWTGNSVMQLLAVDLLVYIWHNLPIVGRAAGPVMQFISIRDSLGVHRAAALSILGLWGPLEYWCFQFIRLWRASRVLGEELVEEWVARTVPHEQRSSWLRANGMTITLFVAPQALLMQLPFIGPLVYVPMQFSAAWLLDLLLRQQPATGEVAVPDHTPYASHHAPTKPPPMHPVQEPPSSAAQYQQHFPPVQYQQQTPPVQPSAPPYPEQDGSGQGNVQPRWREGYPVT
ncbi:g1313 [Coccomyxa elongata]